MAEHEPERLEAKFGDRSIGITTRDIIPVLLITMMGLGAYLLYQNIRWSMQAIYGRQGQLLDRLREQDEKLAFQTREFARLIAIHDYNMGRPSSERLPLEIDASWLPQQLSGHHPLRRSETPPSAAPLPTRREQDRQLDAR